MARGTMQIGHVAPVRTGDAKADRAQEQMAGKVNALVGQFLTNAIPVEVTLRAGVNKIGHGSGRRIKYFIPAAVSDPAAVVSSDQDENPHPELQVWVRLTGATQARALLILLPAVR